MTWQPYLLLIYIPYITYASFRSHTFLAFEKKDAGAVGAAVSVVDTIFGIPSKLISLISGAIDLDKKINEGKSAAAVFNVTNYSSFLLSSIEYIILSGVIENELYDTVDPGERLVIGGSAEDSSKNTEAIALFDVANDWQCFYYWRVASKGSSRKPNRMAVGCYPEKDHIAMRNQIEENFKSSGNGSELPMCFLTYKDHLYTARFCGTEDMPICIEGRMQPQHKSIGRVNIFPKKAANFASKFADYVKQDRVDQLMRKTCDRSGEPNGSIRKTIDFYLALVAIIFLCP